MGRMTSSKNSKKSVSDLKTTLRKYAIISVNRNQYSETFIQSHFELIENAIVYSDGYLPTSISIDQGETWEDLDKRKDSELRLIESWKTHNVQSVLAEYGPAGVEVMYACRKANIPLIVHFHGFDAYRDDVLSHYGEQYKELFKIASKIIVVSKDMYSQVLSLGCPADKLEQISYGVNTEMFSPPPISDEKRSGFIACGRFVHKKSPFNTIKAFAKVVETYPKAKLTFIGDGELKESAISLVRELKLDSNVDFKGVLTQKEVASELQKHAIFVQHSVRTGQNDSEGTPLSILEAASTGLAIVSTNHAGIPDVIEDNKSGFLVNEGDVDAMADRMITVLKNPHLRKQFGVAARETVTSKFDQVSYIKRLSNTLESATVPEKIDKRSKVWKTRVIIFLLMFLIAEIGLRLVGYNPGVIEDFYYHKGEVEYDSLLYADDKGITHAVDGAKLIDGGKVNTEGFFSAFEFTKKSIQTIRESGKKVVMLIGDSFTQGCCADHVDSSFAQLLNQSDDYVILNFGIPGADPVQYKLITEKYAPILKPDLIVVAVYGGNDILEYNRTAKPFVPLSYPIKKGPWLNSEGPIYLTEQGTYFKNFDEAKGHYYEYFSLWSDQSSFFEKNIRYSVILSRFYLKWKTKLQYEEIKHQMPKSLERMPYSQKHLDSLRYQADSLNIPVIFSLIPSPSDVLSKLNLHKKYDFVFGDITYSFPIDLQINDYDGYTDANHFNNEGHRKYSGFLENLIDSVLSE